MRLWERNKPPSSGDSGQSDGKSTECLREKGEISGVKMFREGRGGMTQQTLPNFQNFIILETAQVTLKNQYHILMKTNINVLILQ